MGERRRATRRGTEHYATAGMTGSGDRFMGVKKWPGPLNRVIKCRYFKQQSELECASELYLRRDTSSKLTWKFLGQLFPRRYITQFLLLEWWRAKQ